MSEYDGFKKAGSFSLADGTRLQGELSLKGAATTLDLYSDTEFDSKPSRDIFGVFNDRSKASLVHCVTVSAGRGSRGGEQYYFSRVFPHFVVLGDRHIGSSDATIRALSFTVDDASTLFYDFDAFGSVANARPHMERIAESRGARRPIEIGEHPLVFYFTGKHEVLSVRTILGEISVSHEISFRSPGPEGIHVDNVIRLSVAFESGRTLVEAIAGVLELLRFIEVIAGRPQNVSKVALESEGGRQQVTSLNVYWCVPPQRDRDSESEKPHPGDLPIKAAENPDEFSFVLKSWLARGDSWRNARTRFSAAFAYQKRYGIERIVGAANAFDILPQVAWPEATVLGPAVEQARDNAREAFRRLPASPERDSVLSALGRVGQATLKRKVRSRAKVITDSVGDRFPELEMVVDQAVDCRNFYVHGSEAMIDYSEHVDQACFLTDTLEFVFAASDLVDSGWNIAAWITQGSVLSHPFARYRFGYPQRLAALRALF